MNLLLLVHGMGNHTPQSFESEVVNGCNNALMRYESYKNHKFKSTDGLKIVSVGYNDIFEKQRKAYSQSGENLEGFIKLKLTKGSSQIPSFVNELAGIEQKFGSDDFIYTHILDVVFYLTLIGETVRLKVAEKMVAAIRKYQDPELKIHILAHSLGTAVTHDTLNKLYADGFNNAIKLDRNTLPINSLWSFANVSPIITQLSGLTGPRNSVVKPTASGGCIVSYQNIFHKFDPFTVDGINRFNPRPTDNWIDREDYDLFYKCYQLDKVARKNTHSIGGYIDTRTKGGYLEDPLVCHDFLASFMKFSPNAAEKKAGDDAYKNLQADTTTAKAEIQHLQKQGGISNLKKIIEVLKSYVKMIDDMPA